MLLKEKLVFVFLMLGLYTLHAQERNKFKLGVEVAPTISTGLNSSLGFLVAIEPKFNNTENSAVGLKIGRAVAIERNIKFLDDFQFNEVGWHKVYEVLSLAATFDQYLGKPNSKFQPFAGGGLSYYKASGVGDIDTQDNPTMNFSSNTKIKGQLGILLRGGFELGKFRLGVEHNFIPKSNIKLPNGDIAGSVKDSYFSVSFGCTIGGGKWRDL